MCFKRIYKNHWLKYNEALTHQLNRMRRGSPSVFWSIAIFLLVNTIAVLTFGIWLIWHLLVTKYKERE
jgi:hypothetical protein